jgi:hypothetical protein
MRVLVVLTVLVCLAGPAPASAAGSRPTVRAGVLDALEVLHEWDDRRSLAWASVDEQALRSLYAPGSAAARADVRLLRSYRARGLVVRRIVTQVFGVVVLRRERDRLVLRVRDRVAGGVVLERGRESALSGTTPVVRRLELRLVGGAWRLATG